MSTMAARAPRSPPQTRGRTFSTDAVSNHLVISVVGEPTAQTMRKIVCLVTVLVTTIPWMSQAASTINPTNAYSWGANIGYLNWRPSSANGVNVGAYICQ